MTEITVNSIDSIYESSKIEKNVFRATNVNSERIKLIPGLPKYFNYLFDITPWKWDNEPIDIEKN